MPSVYDIYERKNYRNRIPLAQAVSFEVEVRETNLQIQARTDLSPKAKDSVFRYRYQIEEYLRQHPAFRETASPIQIYAGAPEIVRYCDASSRSTGVAPMACMGGAIADFVGRDLAPDSPNLIVSSGGDSFIKCAFPLDVYLYAKGSRFHELLVLALPSYQRSFGISTFVPGKGIHAVTVLSRSACWASAFSKDLGERLTAGEALASVLKRAEAYTDVGSVILVAGETIVLGGDMVLRSANGGAAQ
ncbi:MAG: hypothetical protein WCG29_11225 [Desulfomonile sp.]|jgi:ApbE superfamily uncharacterized protein (UPF0280 family)|nr:hypothetical protein [Deltaproteobacteria bacterium]